MTYPRDGGPAFPRLEFIDTDGGHIGPPGMSLRDWFAGQALAGLMPDQVHPNDGWSVSDAIARDAYAQADAMLRAREPGHD